MPNEPRTDEDYAAVRRLHAQGLGRNEIADQIGRSRHLVSLLARDMGLAFPRAAEVEIAMETRRAQLARRRLDLAEALQADAEALREQMWQPATVYAFGGRDNVYEEHTLPEPPAADKRALMATIGTAIDRSLKLEPAAAGDNAAEARSMLGALADGIRRIAGEADTGEG